MSNIKIRYYVESYIDAPRQWDIFKELADIHIDNHTYSILYNPIEDIIFIREYFIQPGQKKYDVGTILVSIESDELHEQIVQIAKKEGILK